MTNAVQAQALADARVVAGADQRAGVRVAERLHCAFLIWLNAGWLALLCSIAPWGSRSGLPIMLWVLLSWPLALWALFPLLWRIWRQASAAPASPKQALLGTLSRLLFGLPAWVAWTVVLGVVDVFAGPSTSMVLDVLWQLVSLALSLWIASPLLRLLGRLWGGPERRRRSWQ